MKRMFRHAAAPSALVGSLALAALMALPAPAHAAAPKKQAAKSADAVAAPAKPATDAAYEQWLKKYGAYDRIVVPSDIADDGTGNSSLKRAEAYLMQGTPQQALDVVQSQQPYEDKTLEIQRLWLGGHCYRALGDPYKAVIWYSHAAKLMDDKQIKAKLSAEAGLEALWVDVWRRQFWAFVGNASASRDGIEQTLRTLLEQAEKAWGPENFWLKAKESLALATGDEAAPAPAKGDKPAKEAGLAISPADRQLIAQAVAAASLEDYSKAKGYLAEVSAPVLRDFWSGLLTFLSSGKTPDTKSLNNSGYAKASGFWNANLLAPYAGNREEWLLGGSAPAWARFKGSLAQLSGPAAQDAVDKEMQSLLLSEEMSRLLRSVKFVLCLEDGNIDAAQEIWNGLDKRKLPVTLRIAGGLMFKEDIKALLPQEIGAATKLSPALSALLAAGGTGAPLAGEAPFWTKAEIGKSSSVNKVWPLDRLLVLADWQARWVAGPGSELARRSAFLFPDTGYGYDCLIYLTQRAVENRQFQLAEAYLGRMAALSTDKKRTISRLSLKGKMERESGRDEQALATYQEMLALGVEMDTKARLDIATFLQLKGDFDGGRKQLLILWDQRDKMPKPLQAEILFWLGEGEHSLKNYDAALDYYLRLAYQYPQEPMWPTVAMYRSAMIYEIKGNYEAAKKLLNSVIATADTKEAQEAAKNRLSALENKTGKPAAKESGEPVYPF